MDLVPVDPDQEQEKEDDEDQRIDLEGGVDDKEEDEDEDEKSMSDEKEDWMSQIEDEETEKEDEGMSITVDAVTSEMLKRAMEEEKEEQEREQAKQLRALEELKEKEEQERQEQQNGLRVPRESQSAFEESIGRFSLIESGNKKERVPRESQSAFEESIGRFSLIESGNKKERRKNMHRKSGNRENQKDSLYDISRPIRVSRIPGMLSRKQQEPRPLPDLPSSNNDNYHIPEPSILPRKSETFSNLRPELNLTTFASNSHLREEEEDDDLESVFSEDESISGRMSMSGDHILQQVEEVLRKNSQRLSMASTGMESADDILQQIEEVRRTQSARLSMASTRSSRFGSSTFGRENRKSRHQSRAILREASVQLQAVGVPEKEIPKQSGYDKFVEKIDKFLDWGEAQIDKVPLDIRVIITIFILTGLIAYIAWYLTDEEEEPDVTSLRQQSNGNRTDE